MRQSSPLIPTPPSFTWLKTCQLALTMTAPPPRYTRHQLKQLLAAPAYTTAVGSKMWLENEYVRMWDFHSVSQKLS